MMSSRPSLTAKTPTRIVAQTVSVRHGLDVVSVPPSGAPRRAATSVCLQPPLALRIGRALIP